MWLTFFKDHITENEDATGHNVLDLVITMSSSIAQKFAFHTPQIEFRAPINLDTIHSRDFSPTLRAKSPEMGNILSFPSKRLKRNLPRVVTRGNEIARGNQVRSGLCPIGVAKPRVAK